MSMTNAQKRKQAKMHNRSHRLRKMRNIQRNASSARFRLDVMMDGKWQEGVMRFRDWNQIRVYQALTEKRRQAGETIMPGKVVSSLTDMVVLEIAGSKPKGALPDKITDGVKADPNVTGGLTPEQRAEEAMARLEAVSKAEVITGEPDK